VVVVAKLQWVSQGYHREVNMVVVEIRRGNQVANELLIHRDHNRVCGKLSGGF